MLHRLVDDPIPSLHPKVLRWSPLLVGGDTHLLHRAGSLQPPVSVRHMHLLRVLAGHGHRRLAESQGPSEALCHCLEPSVFITSGNRRLKFHRRICGPQGQQSERLGTPLCCMLAGPPPDDDSWCTVAPARILRSLPCLPLALSLPSSLEPLGESLHCARSARYY